MICHGFTEPHDWESSFIPHHGHIPPSCCTTAPGPKPITCLLHSLPSVNTLFFTCKNISKKLLQCFHLCNCFRVLHWGSHRFTSPFCMGATKKASLPSLSDHVLSREFKPIQTQLCQLRGSRKLLPHSNLRKFCLHVGRPPDGQVEDRVHLGGALILAVFFLPFAQDLV